VEAVSGLRSGIVFPVVDDQGLTGRCRGPSGFIAPLFEMRMMKNFRAPRTPSPWPGGTLRRLEGFFTCQTPVFLFLDVVGEAEEAVKRRRGG
jgi:hypothetical protein